MENTTSNTPQDGDSKNQSEEIGAFWKRTSRNNMTYLAGHIKVSQPDGTEKTEKVVVFSNQHKKAENQPDYRVYISNTEKRAPTGDAPQTQTQETEKEELL